MIKTVNVYAAQPAYIDGINFSGPANGIELDTDTIRKCLQQRILVREVLDDGTVVQLGFDNYDKDLDGDDDVSILDDDDEQELPKFKIYSVGPNGDNSAVEAESKSTIEKIIEDKKEKETAPKEATPKETPIVTEVKDLVEDDKKEDSVKVIDDSKKKFNRK